MEEYHRDGQPQMSKSRWSGNNPRRDHDPRQFGDEWAILRTQPHRNAGGLRAGIFIPANLAVQHPMATCRLRRAAKDIIISGGETISSIEVEGVLMGHPDWNLAAVVAQPMINGAKCAPGAFIEP